MSSDNHPTALLALHGVCKHFVKSLDMAARLANVFGASMEEKIVRAVDDFTLTIAPGEVVGLVGESGCGKSTLGRMAVGLLSPSSGQRFWKGEEIDKLPPSQKRKKQLGMQMIFQNPYASLNPCMRVQEIIGEAPVAHGIITAAHQKEYVEELLQRVGLDANMLRRFPYQFSSGQRARIGIARALAVKPEFLVCDEATAALDVSIQAQVLNLFIGLRDELGLAYLFISHDLGVVRRICDRVVIMYFGRVVESALVEEIFARANHPYTLALLASIPKLEAKKTEFLAIKGEISSPFNPPSGCHFHPRCPHASQRCRKEMPRLKEISPGHLSSCHLNDY